MSVVGIFQRDHFIKIEVKDMSTTNIDPRRAIELRKIAREKRKKKRRIMTIAVLVIIVSLIITIIASSAHKAKKKKIKDYDKDEIEFI